MFGTPDTPINSAKISKKYMIITDKSKKTPELNISQNEGAGDLN